MKPTDKTGLIAQASAVRKQADELRAKAYNLIESAEMLEAAADLIDEMILPMPPEEDALNEKLPLGDKLKDKSPAERAVIEKKRRNAIKKSWDPRRANAQQFGTTQTKEAPQPASKPDAVKPVVKDSPAIAPNDVPQAKPMTALQQRLSSTPF
jgi:hypothetical protein